MKHCIRCILLFTFLISSLKTQAGVDSLLQVLKISKPDTNRVNVLNKLCWEIGIDDYDQAFKYGKQAEALAESLNWPKGVAAAYNNIGGLYQDVGELDTALYYYERSLEIRENLNNKKLIADSYGNIGLIYANKGELKKALVFQLKSLRLREEINYKPGVAMSYSNIARVYGELDINKAIEYYNKALAIDTELNDLYGMASDYNNLATCYNKIGDYQKALNVLEQGVRLSKELNDHYLLANNYTNIANTYYHQGSRSNNKQLLKKALHFHLESLKISSEVGDQIVMVQNNINIGSVLELLDRYSEAIEHFKEALSVSTRTGYADGIEASMQGLASCYEATGSIDLALKYFKRATQFRDSLLNSENNKHILEMQTKYESEKKEKQIALQQVELQKKDTLVKQKDTQRNFFIAGFVFVAILGFVSYRGYLQKKRTNTILEFANAEITHQKNIIEEKNKDITDSIVYAKQIQTAILIDESQLNQIFNEYFILFQPKDIVSGDFYWCTETNDKILWAAADCTGHGVPGAFMSMLGNSFLNEIVNEKGITEPNLILDELRAKIIKSLDQNKEENKRKDGMDIGLCCYDKGIGVLSFSGANNGCWLITSNTLPVTDKILHITEDGDRRMYEIKPNKMPIGSYVNQHPFTSIQVKLSAGDMIYTFTDGFADQFGGEKGKKFRQKNLQKLIFQVKDFTMKEQFARLETELQSWKGDHEQIDDITVFGVKV